MAVTEPSTAQPPPAGFGQSALIDWMFGASVVVGNSSGTDLLAASVARCVTVLETATWLSELSRTAVTLKQAVALA